VKTAQITYYGAGPLNLQMRRFKPGSSVKARLDDILPDERRRYGDRFLVVGPDGLIINIGDMVPDAVAKIVIGENPRILRIPGFSVRVPMGYALDDSGAEPMVVDASVMAAKQAEDRNGTPVRTAPVLELLKDDDDGRRDDDDERAGGEDGPIQRGKSDNEKPDGEGSAKASGGGGSGSGADHEGAELGEGDGDSGEAGSVDPAGPTFIDTKPAKRKGAPKKRPPRRGRKPVAQKTVSKADKLMELF